jgi:hypothetical protein
MNQRWYALIKKILARLIVAVRQKQWLAIATIAVGLVVVFVGWSMSGGAYESITKIVALLSGGTVGSLSFMPIAQIIDHKKRVSDLESILETVDAEPETDIPELNSILTKLVEQAALGSK